MELDKRIKEGKHPLNCFDTEQAWQFIGKQCYFSDDVGDFSDLSKADGDSDFYIAELQNIWNEVEDCFADNSADFRFILPCEWVEEEKKEPKYRPYSLKEWIEQHEIGEVIHYRSKSGEIELRQMYVGTRHSQGIKKIILKITLGDVSHTLDYLFENYEIEVNGEWQPFGVLEDD